MKKSLSIFMCLVFCLSVLAGCGTKNEKESITKQPEVSQEVQEPPVENKEEEKPTDIPEEVLIDSDGIKVTITGLEYPSMSAPEVKFLIENNTDRNVVVTVNDDVSVNDLMVDALLYSEVMAHKKINDKMTFTEKEFQSNSIEKIATLEFSMKVFSKETIENETIVETDRIVLESPDKDTYIQKYDDSGTILYEDDIAKIILKGAEMESMYSDPRIWLYIENKSDKELVIQASDVSVNGFMISSIISTNISTGKKARTSITFFSTDFEENNIDKFIEAETKFVILDANGTIGNERIKETEPIKMTFE